MNQVKQRAATLENDGIDIENRKARFTFMTEAPCENWYVPEVCLCKAENADITRFKNGVAPCLFNHNRDMVIAKIERVYSEDNRYKAEVIFDKDEQSETIFQKCISGSLRGVSVGYIPKEVKRVKSGDTYKGIKYERETDVVSKWELLEVSIVSIPADSDSGVGRELADNLTPKNIQEKENKKMSENDNTQKTVEDLKKDFQAETKALTEKANAELKAAVEAEKKRTAEIIALCRKHNVDADKFITEGKTLAEVTASILEMKAQEETPVKAQVTTGATSAEQVREAMVSGLCKRYGLQEDGDEKYSHVSVRDIMVECLEREGNRDARYMNDDLLIDKARAMGSGQFLGIIEDFANKAKSKAVREHLFIYKNFVSRGYNKDFKLAHRYEMSLAGDPVKMEHESMEFKYQSMRDEAVTTGVSTYGKAIAFTREILINDELGQVADVISRQAAGFERVKEKIFFELLSKASNYSAAKKNLVSTNKDISASAYDEMYQLMMNQMDIDEKGYVGVAPKFLVAPINQNMQHRVLLSSGAKIDQGNPAVINPVQGLMKLFVTPYLTGTAYYAIANPNELPGIEYTTLAGRDGLQSRTIIPSHYLGIEYQMWEDFGFNFLTHKAFVKNPNA